MNELTFRLIPPTEFDPGEVRIFIDGRDLVDLVRDVELPFATAAGDPGRAGDYAGLELRAVAPPSRHFWGKPLFEIYESDGLTQLLECAGCREPGCRPLYCRVDVDDNRVRWSEFRASMTASRSEWDYSPLGPFEFDRTRYDAVVQALPNPV
jgi:hypothetical protein